MRPGLQTTAWLLSVLALAIHPTTGRTQDQTSSTAYPWMSELPTPLPATTPLDKVFAPPQGFTRVEVAEHSFSKWLRTLPIRNDRTRVLSYRGTRLDRPSAGVVLMDVGERDLMQCADSILRLHAEYLWAESRADEAAYRFTSGDETRWTDWTRGERFIIQGSTVTRKTGEPRSKHHKNYRKWLDLVFTYAGTTSIARDVKHPGDSSPVSPGDFYVDPGSPGHAVLVLDVAEDTLGNRLALIGQGFMPAEEFHVLKSTVAVDKVWFPLPGPRHSVLDTPSWRPFYKSARRRLP